MFLAGFTEVVQLLCEGEDQQAAAGQTRNEHTQRHAGNSQPGECNSVGRARDAVICCLIRGEDRKNSNN